MPNLIYWLSLAIALLCYYYTFYMRNLYLIGDGIEITKRQRTIKYLTKLSQTKKNTSHHFNSVILYNICNSTLLYPKYNHSSKCYPHLYFSNDSLYA